MVAVPQPLPAMHAACTCPLQLVVAEEGWIVAPGTPVVVKLAVTLHSGVPLAFSKVNVKVQLDPGLVLEHPAVTAPVAPPLVPAALTPIAVPSIPVATTIMETPRRRRELLVFTPVIAFLRGGRSGRRVPPCARPGSIAVQQRGREANGRRATGLPRK